MEGKSRLVIWNPNAGSVEQAEEVREQLQSLAGIKFHETSSGDEAQQLASSAAENGFAVVVAAGGDGTVNAVVNGLYQSNPRPALGILPLGTGNDLCRTLNIPLDPLAAAELLTSDSASMWPIDLVRVKSSTGSSVYANVCSGGNSHRVSESMTGEMKRGWGAWSYLRGAIDVLTDLTGFNVTVKVNDEPEKSYELWNVVVANGKTAAGGVSVAPKADIGDGFLDVILIENGTLLDVAGLSTNFFLSNYLEDERVTFRRAKRVQFDSDPPMQFVADGETVASTPVAFAIDRQALNVVVP